MINTGTLVPTLATVGWLLVVCGAVELDNTDAAAAAPVVVNDLRGFDDSILFDIDWSEDKTFNPQIEDEYLVNDAVLKNEYSCAIPRLEAKLTESTTKEYTGRSPLELISDLFTTAACSFRAESYWTYEVCHGDYIKQFHEEREGKSVKVQEYLLGRWSKKHTEALRKRLEAAERRNEPVRSKKIEGLTLPYLELELTDGTACGLIDNKPRQSRVLYVCYPHGKNEVYSLKEVSTCQYEVIILTQVLCEHPAYKPVAAVEKHIRCSPTVPGAPVPPQNAWTMSTVLSTHLQKLVALNMEPEIEQFTRILADIGAAIKNHPTTPTSGVTVAAAENAATTTTATTAAIASNEAPTSNVPTAPATAPTKAPATAPETEDDDGSEAINNFLTGEMCLTGGHGWWKYEFCNGKHVRQFHQLTNNRESSMMLGHFNADTHRAWVRANPEKRPSKASGGGKATLSHLYSGGTLCELTGQPRQTEVKLKCMESVKEPYRVEMYLLEPVTCQYVLSVESPLVCAVIESVDEDGLVPSYRVVSLK